MLPIRRTAVALFLLAAVARAGEPVELTDATFESVRDRVLPSKDEERWREIPWRTSAWDAVAEATETDRPVLLWAMNGHPLACT
jgi:hypothetical protein